MIIRILIQRMKNNSSDQFICKQLLSINGVTSVYTNSTRDHIEIEFDKIETLSEVRKRLLEIGYPYYYEICSGINRSVAYVCAAVTPSVQKDPIV